MKDLPALSAVSALSALSADRQATGRRQAGDRQATGGGKRVKQEYLMAELKYLAHLKIFGKIMEYNKLIAVAGLPGLYELVNSKTDGAIVRSLEDNSTKFASSRIHNFSQLESIEVFTIRENVNLAEIFQAMDKAGDPLPDGKDNSVLKKYFEKIYPDLDFERVYASDLRKMVKWFDILKKHKIEIKFPEPIAEPEEEEEKKEEAKDEIAVTEENSSTAPATEKPAEKIANENQAAENVEAEDDSLAPTTVKKKRAPKKK